jgi:hypothetical protein
MLLCFFLLVRLHCLFVYVFGHYEFSIVDPRLIISIARKRIWGPRFTFLPESPPINRYLLVKRYSTIDEV